MITISDTAVKEIKRLAQEQGLEPEHHTGVGPADPEAVTHAELGAVTTAGHGCDQGS